jgi:hypothetical protein
MTLRVLFADDQFPSPYQVENERTRNEIRRELGAKIQDVDGAFDADFHWFQRLCDYLNRKGVEIIGVSFVRASPRQNRKSSGL